MLGNRVLALFDSSNRLWFCMRSLTRNVIYQLFDLKIEVFFHMVLTFLHIIVERNYDYIFVLRLRKTLLTIAVRGKTLFA